METNRESESIDSDIGSATDGVTTGKIADPPAVATPAKGALTRDAFIERAKSFGKRPTVQRVELPWMGDGAHAFVRGMTARERDQFEASMVVRDPKDGKDRVVTDDIRTKMLIKTVCNEDGVRLFADHEADHLAGIDAKTADALYGPAQSLSGVTDADIKEMAKNSERARSGASSSPSDSNSSDASRTS